MGLLLLLSGRGFDKPTTSRVQKAFNLCIFFSKGHSVDFSFAEECKIWQLVSPTVYIVQLPVDSYTESQSGGG